MAYWLLKTEPSGYSWADLVRDGQTVWDGVRSAQACNNIAAMRPGDQALIYHSGDERRVVGLAGIVSEPRPDPDLAHPKLVVVDVRAIAPVGQPVTLAMVKAEPIFAQLALVRQPRLSVLPVTAEQWQRLLELGQVQFQQQT